MKKLNEDEDPLLSMVQHSCELARTPPRVISFWFQKVVFDHDLTVDKFTRWKFRLRGRGLFESLLT